MEGKVEQPFHVANGKGSVSMAGDKLESIGHTNQLGIRTKTK